jgi:hypothetical protein
VDWVPSLNDFVDIAAEQWPRAVVLVLVVVGFWLYLARHARSFRRTAAAIGFLPDPANHLWEFDLGKSRLYRKGDQVRNLLRGSVMGVPILLFELHPRLSRWHRAPAEGKPLTITAAPLPLSGPPPSTVPYTSEGVDGYLLLYEEGILLTPSSLRCHVLDVLSLTAPDKFVLAMIQPDHARVVAHRRFD